MEKKLGQKKVWLASQVAQEVKAATSVKPCKHQMAVATWVLNWNGKTVIIEDNGER